MSFRLQILIPDNEYREVVKASKKEAKKISEWVRESIRSRLKFTRPESPEIKLARILKFAKYQGPTADIDQMLAEIEKGRTADDLY